MILEFRKYNVHAMIGGIGDTTEDFTLRFSDKEVDFSVFVGGGMQLTLSTFTFVAGILATAF